jgi:hypothetical protein
MTLIQENNFRFFSCVIGEFTGARAILILSYANGKLISLTWLVLGIIYFVRFNLIAISFWDKLVGRFMYKLFYDA